MLRRAMAAMTVALGLLAPGVWIAAPAAAQELGLAERRAIKNYQDAVYPGIKQQIDAAAGMPVPVEVAWDKIAIPGKAADFAEPGFWTDIYFTPLVNALKSITADDMGKQALAAKLKKIVITHDSATAPASNYDNGVAFKDGTFTINFHPYSNASDVKQRSDAMQKALEKAL